MPCAPAPEAIGVPAVFVAVSIGITVPLTLFVTYARLPSGVIATYWTPAPTGMAVPAVFVATAIGVTVPDVPLTTYTVLPSGVTATPSGPVPKVVVTTTAPVETVRQVSWFSTQL